MKMKLALIGAGQRGMIYAEYAYDKKGAEIVAVVEPHKERREIAGARKGGKRSGGIFCGPERFETSGGNCKTKDS